MSAGRSGALYGFLAYFMWGLFPLYWPLLAPSSAIEILSHRIVWSAVAMALVILLARKGRALRSLVRDRRRLALLAVAAVVVSGNWLVYIWGVNSGRVVETSLGYFINPLVTVLMGVLVLGERMRPLQWASLGVASVAVVVLTVDYGRLPWVALALALTFGTYGLAKKQANAGALESLALETGLLAPFAIAFVLVLANRGDSTFGNEGWVHLALLVGAGLVTAVPLVLFGAAATRLSMVSLGLLQYLAPILQFLIGVLVFREEMPAGRWIGFALVWLALVLLTAESIRYRRRQLVMAANASAV